MEPRLHQQCLKLLFDGLTMPTVRFVELGRWMVTVPLLIDQLRTRFPKVTRLCLCKMSIRPLADDTPEMAGHGERRRDAVKELTSPRVFLGDRADFALYIRGQLFGYAYLHKRASGLRLWVRSSRQRWRSWRRGRRDHRRRSGSNHERRRWRSSVGFAV